MLSVEAFAATDDPCALVHRHAGAVVLDAQQQVAVMRAGADADLPKAQPVGVFQQVAEQLHQRALFHRYDTGLDQLHVDLHALVAIDLVQRAAQAVEQRPQFDPVAHQAALAEAGTLQLIADLLAHALDLRLHHLRLLAALALRRERLADALQHAERGFQAVRQIARGVAVLLALATLAVQQAVQRTGQAQQFARVVVAQTLALPGFDWSSSALTRLSVRKPGQA